MPNIISSLLRTIMYSLNTKGGDSHPTKSQRNHADMGIWIIIAFGSCCTIYFSGIMQFMPAYIALIAGSFMLTLAPGFSLFSLFSLFQPHSYPRFTIFLVSISMGMTFNFIVNVAVFIAQPNLSTALNAYLLVVIMFYLTILARWKYMGLVKAPRWHSLYSKRFVICAALFVVFSLALFLRQPSVLFSEELLVLRKITDNFIVAHNNISISQGETATYFFVPLYMLLAMVGKIAGLDAYAALSGLWPFTALVSLLCLVKISHLLTGRWSAGFALSIMGLVYAVFLASTRADFFVVFIPFPDRYAVSAALLLPLAVFHFLVHMEHKQINIPTFVGLIYLIVEMTFIHARETIFTLVIIFCVCLVLALNYRANRQHLLRVLWLILLVVLCLASYKVVNLIIQPFLKDFVAVHRQDMVSALEELWATRGVRGLFHELDAYPTWNYGRFSSCYWNNAGYLYLPLTIFFLPLYVLCADRVRMLYIPLAASLFGLYSVFGGLRLLLGIAVGVPFVFDCYSILGIMLTLIFVDMLRITVLFLLSIRTIWIRVCIIAVCTFALVSICTMASSKFASFTQWTTSHDVVFYVLCLAAVIIQQRMLTKKGPLPLAVTIRRIELGQAPNGVTAKALLACAALFFSMLKPLCVGSSAFPTQYFRTQLPDESSCTINTIISCYPINAKPTSSSLSLIDFIRINVSPGSNWLGTDTVLPLIAANMYSPVVIADGYFHSGYEINHPFIIRWMPGHNPILTTSFLDLITSLQPSNFSRLLVEESIDWLLIDIKFHPQFMKLAGDVLFAKGQITVAYTDKNVIIYRVSP